MNGAISEIFGPDLWRDVGRQLRGESFEWWKEHRKSIEGLTRNELFDVAQKLRAGQTLGARVVLVRRMSPDEYDAYVAGTTAQLVALARRRNDLIVALRKLGVATAKIIGAAILGVLA